MTKPPFHEGNELFQKKEAAAARQTFSPTSSFSESSPDGPPSAGSGIPAVVPEKVGDRYFDLFDRAPVGYVTLCGQGTILDANRQAARLLGATRDELVRQPLSLYIHPQDRDFFGRHLHRIFETGEPQGFDLQMAKQDGPGWWAHLEACLEKETDEAPLCYVVLNDITGRKQIEEVQLFLAQTSSGLSDTSFFHLLAPCLAGCLGMDFVCIDRLEGNGLWARTLAVWCDGHFEDNVSYALKDTPCGDVVGQTVCCFPAHVCRLFPRDPVLQDLRAESYLGVTLFSHTGKPIGLIAVIGRRPLAHRPVAESILQLVAGRAAGELERLMIEEVLHDITASIPGAVYRFIRHPDGSVEIPFLSEGAGPLFGRSLEELKDFSRIAEIVHPDDVHGMLTSIEESAHSMRPWVHEFRILPGSGETKWLSAQSNPRALPDGSICWNGTILDITGRKKFEEALQESERILRMALRIGQIGMFEVDMDTGRARWTPEFGEIWGIPDDFQGRLADFCWQHLHPDDLARIQKDFERVIQSREVRAMEFRVRRDDGQLRWIRWLGQAVQISGAGPLKTVGVNQDVTEQKQAEEALRRAEIRFQKAFRHSPDAVSISRLRDGLFVEVNPGSLTTLGYAPEELLGRTSAEVGIWVESGERRRMVGLLLSQGEVSNFEARLLGKDGSEHVVLVSASLIFLDNEAHILSTTRDITERKRAETERRESERRFRDILMSMADWVWEVDEHGVYTFSSEKGLEYFGTKRGGILGKKPFDFMPPEEAAKVGPIFADLMARRQPIRDLENWNLNGKGERICLLTNGVPILDEQGHLKGYRGVDKDITERKRAEEEKVILEIQLQQAQKMEAVGRLAGGVAHDFNNMLNVILGHADLVLDRMGPSDPWRAHLEEIRKAADRSAALTRQLLAFARKQVISPRVLRLNETIEGLLGMLRRLIGEQIELAWVPGKQADAVKMDPMQIDQILVNLCVNARDAIKGVGKVIIETGMQTGEEMEWLKKTDSVSGRYVWMAVRDNGCGMGKATLEKLFEPFFTTKEMGRGTGLGLATVYGIVKQNGGLIQVDSLPDRGTTFKIFFPHHSGKTETGQEACAEESAPRGHETILLVEDEPAILKMTQSILELHGYQVLCASSPEGALQLAQKHTGPIHLLMTDVIMPEMNGQDLSRKISVFYPDIKFLFMSGYTADVIADQGVLASGLFFLEKPFRIKEVVSKVREVLDRG